MPDGARLPHWPFVLRRPEAAAYVGLSTTTFDQRVAPVVPAVILSPGRIGWRRADLERWANGLPLTRVDAAPSSAEPAPVAPAETPDARDAIAESLAALAARRRPRRAGKAR